MTYSGDRSGTVEGQTSGPVVSELSPEDLEQLATEFRPSWELDEAPFAGGANFSSADVQSLQGGEARNRARQALVTTTDEGFLSGRRDRGSNHPPAGAARVSSRPPAPIRSTPPPAFALAPMRAPALSLESTMQARRFRRGPPWIAIGVVGAILVALGVWATSSSDASQVGAPPASPPHETSAAAPASPPAEPPKETQAPAPAPAPPPEPAVATSPEPAAVPAAKPPAEAHAAPAQAMAPPAPAARPAQAASAPARPPAAAKPATHSKAGPTIVRDVPF
jgi:hypothetical protein